MQRQQAQAGGAVRGAGGRRDLLGAELQAVGRTGAVGRQHPGAQP
jgi:hypothetical protein